MASKVASVAPPAEIPAQEPGGASRSLPSQADFPAFRARFPWLGGDLQTLRNFLVRRRADLSPWPGRRLVLDLDDGSGDRLAAMLNQPGQAERTTERPLVVLIHGLTGCETSFHILSAAASFLRHGYPVLRLNLRGAGPSAATCRERYHAGRSEDLRAALRSLERDHPGLLGGGLVVMGSSLGANMITKFLAEHGRGVPLRAAVLISAPVDLKAAQVRIMAPRNAIYHRYLLDRMKQECLAETALLTAAEREAVSGSRSIYEFDDCFVAPRGGFHGAEDYYARCSAVRFMPDVAVPTLVIMARNDPWIPFAAYEAFDWAGKPNIVTLFPATGGHVGFHERGGATAWHEGCALRFLDGVLD